MRILFKKAKKTEESEGNELVRSKFAMASCFDFRMRANSLDLHTVHGTRLAKLTRLFRSRSEGSVKGGSPAGSPADSPKSSPAQPPRRRFMRVIRDGQRKGEEYENPHVIRKYTQEYVERQFLTKSVSLEEGTNQLPYTVTGHTILKKHSSLDDSESSPPPLLKHASFKEEVEILEFDVKCRDKLEKGRYTRRERLHDSDSEYDSLSECGPIEESEEEGDDKENLLPLDKITITPKTTTKVTTAKSTTTATTAKCSEPEKEERIPLTLESVEMSSSSVETGDSPPSSPTSDPDKLIPSKKTKIVDGDVQINPKETPRISSPPQLKSES